MYRVGQPAVVHEAYHGLGALLHHEGRPGRHAVVAPKGGIASVGIDLLRQLLDVHLEVLDGLIGDRVGDGAGTLSAIAVNSERDCDVHIQLGGLGRRDGQWELEQPLVFGTEPVLGRGRPKE